MARLVFAKDDVMRVVKHSVEAKQHARGYGHKGAARPQIILVKDDGIYLMSNGKPWDELPDSDPQRAFCAYARGFDPKDDHENLWGKTYAAVGGDDFAEYLDLSPEMTAAILAGEFITLVINVTASRIGMTLMGSKAAVTRPPTEDEMVKRFAKHMKTRILFLRDGKIMQTNTMKVASMKAILAQPTYLAAFKATNRTEVVLNLLPPADAYKVYRSIHPVATVN